MASPRVTSVEGVMPNATRELFDRDQEAIAPAPLDLADVGAV